MSKNNMFGDLDDLINKLVEQIEAGEKKNNNNNNNNIIDFQDYKKKKKDNIIYEYRNKKIKKIIEDININKEPFTDESVSSWYNYYKHSCPMIYETEHSDFPNIAMLFYNVNIDKDENNEIELVMEPIINSYFFDNPMDLEKDYKYIKLYETKLIKNIKNILNIKPSENKYINELKREIKKVNAPDYSKIKKCILIFDKNIEYIKN